MLENVSITVDDNVPWEIASNDNIKQLPHIINVQCSFKPIQDFVPRRINDDNLNVPFITDGAQDYLSIDGYDRFINIAKIETEDQSSRNRDPIVSPNSTIDIAAISQNIQNNLRIPNTN